MNDKELVLNLYSKVDNKLKFRLESSVSGAAIHSMEAISHIYDKQRNKTLSTSDILNF